MKTQQEIKKQIRYIKFVMWFFIFIAVIEMFNYIFTGRINNLVSFFGFGIMGLICETQILVLEN